MRCDGTWIGVAALVVGFESSCDNRRPQPEACSPAGIWTADLVVYDGRLEIGSETPEGSPVVLVGKSRHEGRLVRTASGYDLRMDDGTTTPCVISADCSILDCIALSGTRSAFERSVPAPAAAIP